MKTRAAEAWTRDGLVLPRTAAGDGSEVVGDPCIVWDEDAQAWRMFLFYEPPGHATSIATSSDPLPGDWSPVDVLEFTNPEAMPGGTHKPFVVMEAHQPNKAAKVHGKYWLLVVSHEGDARGKRVQRASSDLLAGPWTLEPGDFIPRGNKTEYDANHVDAVSGYWFEDLDSFVYYYMGYPTAPQPYGQSPYGSAVGVAVQKSTETHPRKLGIALEPSSRAGHWASGWIGGFQLLPGTTHKWMAIINASPTPPRRDGGLTSEEPAPSLGGFAYSDADVPTAGWVLEDEPIEWETDIPRSAREAGEGTNLWRQHILVTGDTVHLYYNSGFYGQEQLYSKSISRAAAGVTATGPATTSR